ncbi:MAG: ABC transporter permease [Planctomycetes bacterium]|nr:ABC transporter permease [Planctomycetota bacterium]MCC7395520.1 ABC transporter permease [Planctomycetota bacterium]
MSGAVLSLWQREIVRFLRDRSRLTGSLLQPVIFWLLFTGALRSSFEPSGMDYGQYFFVGTLAMIALFTAIFSTITVIEDRKEGFLQGVLVSPVPRSTIALGKILGGATLGMGLAVVFLLLAPFAGVSLDAGRVALGLGVLALLSIAVTGLGFTFAWLLDSSAGYHGIMMVLFMPMLLLSGAFFPMHDAHWLMSWIRHVNPMTYGVGALRHALQGEVDGVPSFAVCLLGTVLFAVLMFALGTFVVSRRRARDAV